MKKQRIRLPRLDGLVAEYLLNGNVNDTSGNGNNGTPTNVTYSKTDRGYQTYKGYFAGGSSSKLFVESGFPVLSNTFTVQVWIENTDLSQTGTYVYEKGNYYFRNRHAILYGYVANSYEFFSTVFRGGTITISDTKPHLITYTYDGSQLKAYLDSQLVSTTNASFTLNDANDNFTYGQTAAYGGGTQHKAQGIRFFNRAISADEIRDWYLEGLRALGGSSLSGLMDGLVAYYDFRGDANDIISGYDGTVNGATLTTDRFGTANSAYNFPAGAVILPPSNSQTYRGNDLTVVATVKIPADGGSEHHVVYSTGYLWFNIDSVTISSEHYPTGYTWGVHGKNAGDIVQCVWIKSSTAGVLLYVDGTLIASNPSATGNAAIYEYPTIGYRRWQGSYTAPFLSDLYDLQIYNGVISPERIKAMAELSKQSKLLPFC